MAVETRGTVRMPGEVGPGVEVEVVADESRLSLITGSGLIGTWDVGSFGIKSLHDGFSIQAEGEELVLRTENDVGLAREMGLKTSSPRMARRLAVSQSPPAPVWPDSVPEVPGSYVGAIALALAGVIVIAGSLFLRSDPAMADRSAEAGLRAAGNFWSAFAAGGLLMVVAALVLGVGARWARALAVLSVVALVIVFGNAAQHATPEQGMLLAYGFIAGGLVIGVAVLFGGFLGVQD